MSGFLHSVEGDVMKTIEQDILDIKYGTICHQVNCRGVFGAGLAGQIARKWPIVKSEYLAAYKTAESAVHLLGNVQEVRVSSHIIVVNLFAQLDYGRVPGKVYTDYDALRSCLMQTAVGNNTKENRPIFHLYIPERLGCGLGGGDWATVLRIIGDTIPEAIICSRHSGQGEIARISVH